MYSMKQRAFLFFVIIFGVCWHPFGGRHENIMFVTLKDICMRNDGHSVSSGCSVVWMKAKRMWPPCCYFKNYHKKTYLFTQFPFKKKILFFSRNNANRMANTFGWSMHAHVLGKEMPRWSGPSRRSLYKRMRKKKLILPHGDVWRTRINIRYLDNP